MRMAADRGSFDLDRSIIDVRPVSGHRARSSGPQCEDGERLPERLCSKQIDLKGLKH